MFCFERCSGFLFSWSGVWSHPLREVSNLNRQFLFRKENVGKAKSVTACAAAQDMNTGLRVKAMEVRMATFLLPVLIQY